MTTIRFWGIAEYHTYRTCICRVIIQVVDLAADTFLEVYPPGQAASSLRAQCLRAMNCAKGAGIPPRLTRLAIGPRDSPRKRKHGDVFTILLSYPWLPHAVTIAQQHKYSMHDFDIDIEEYGSDVHLYFMHRYLQKMHVAGADSLFSKLYPCISGHPLKLAAPVSKPSSTGVHKRTQCSRTYKTVSHPSPRQYNRDPLFPISTNAMQEGTKNRPWFQQRYTNII